MHYSFILAALAAVSSAVPTPSPYDASVTLAGGQTTTAIKITTAQILAAAPASKNCPAVAVAGQECATAATAAKGLTDAFNAYGQTSLGQMTALLGLMTLESGDFRFNVNQAKVGQGSKLFQEKKKKTPPLYRYADRPLAKAMLNFNFVYDYAYAQPELKAEVLRLGGGKHLTLTFDTISTVADDVQHNIRALVLVDK